MSNSSKPLVTSAIINFERDPRLAEVFEMSLRCLESKVEQALGALALTEELKCIYIQFLFDTHGMKGAIRHAKLGRYSPKHRDISARVPIPAYPFSVASETGRLQLLRDAIVEILQQVEAKFTTETRAAVAAIRESVEQHV